MDERRKEAYRYLLYWAMLDIRPLAWVPTRWFHWLNPVFFWGWGRRVRRAGHLADWLHNLALFSALDFERFDEGMFWETLRWYEGRHPEFVLSHYRDIFERRLAESRGETGA
jgi:hypothetical protein